MVKYSKVFTFFHLVVAMVSSAESTAWAQHKNSTDWSKWERQTDNKSWQNLTFRKAWNVWHIKSQIGNMEPMAKFIEMETKEKWKWMQQWECVWVVCMCGTLVQGHAKDTAKELGKCKLRASNGWLQSLRKRHQIHFNEVCGEAGNICEKTVADWFALRLVYSLEGPGFKS